MHPTYKEILQDCVAEALLLERDNIPTEIRDLALASMNEHALIFWTAWKWDNEKMDEFEAPATAATGIITFAEDVETVRAVKKVTTGTAYTTRIWNQDELLAAAHGETVSSDRFQHLAADATTLKRRILVEEPGTETPTYKVLALKKYTKAIVDPAYSALTPTATPTDYRVMKFILDRAEPALRAAVKDALRGIRGIPKEGTAKTLLKLALDRETQDSDRELRLEPRAPMFSEVGDWADG